jgi:hypothetical protein
MAQQSTRSDMLVDEFQAACNELRDAILSVPDDRWQSPTPGDGRQVNVVAHHAASAHRPIAEMILAMADGQAPTLSMDQLHAGNAEHARRFSACSRSETLDQHDRGAALAMATLRGLSEDQLARQGQFLVGMPATVEQAVQRVLIGHPREHAATIRAALV